MSCPRIRTIPAPKQKGKENKRWEVSETILSPLKRVINVVSILSNQYVADILQVLSFFMGFFYQKKDNSESRLKRHAEFLNVMTTRYKDGWGVSHGFSYTAKYRHQAPDFWAFSCCRASLADRTSGANCIRSAHCFMKSCRNRS